MRRKTQRLPDFGSRLQARLSACGTVCRAAGGVGQGVVLRELGRVHGPRSLGFTLTELLVTLAILSIVATVAIPVYTGYTERSYRAEAQADLLNCAQAMERFASESFSYLGAADTDGDGAGDGDDGAIAGDICDPLSQRENRYDFTVAAEANGFTLTATPTNAGGNPMRDDGYMTIDDAGLRTWDKDDSGSVDADEETWKY